MVTHISVILSQCQSSVDTCLTRCNRHVGCICNQNSSIHKWIAALWVNKFWKLLKNLSHLVSTLTTSNINNNIGIRPLCNLMLSHRLSCSKSTRNSCGTTLCDWEQCIKNTLSCNKRLWCCIALISWSWHTNWPLLSHRQFFLCSIILNDRYNSLINGVFTIICNALYCTLSVRRKHTLVYNHWCFLNLSDYCSAKYMLSWLYCNMCLPLFVAVKCVYT